MSLTFPTCRTLRKFSSCWHLHTSHYRFGFSLSKTGMAQEVWGKSRSGKLENQTKIVHKNKWSYSFFPHEVNWELIFFPCIYNGTKLNMCHFLVTLTVVVKQRNPIKIQLKQVSIVIRVERESRHLI